MMSEVSAMSHMAEGWLKPAYNADVSVVIVNYNSWVMLERTLATLFESRPRSSLEVIVVDNASTDRSVAMVQEQFPQVRVVANRDNQGLVQANNQGMRLATGRYLMLLNNDIIVFEDTIDALVRYLDAHPAVGAAGCKVLNIDGTIQGSVKDHPTPMAALFGRHSLLTKLWPGNPWSKRYLTYAHHDFRQPFAAGSVSSCAVMVRREAVAAAGPMDPRYFVYWCDVDWCRAIWEAGFAVHCVPESVLIHDEHKGGTRASRQRSKTMVIDFHRGAYLYYRKWSVPHPLNPLQSVAALGLTLRTMLVLFGESLVWRWRRGVGQ